MDIFLNILIALITLVISYIISSYPMSIIIGKIFFKQDPRDYGSHNAGGTNAGRIWGKKVGLIVIILDMIKTISPMIIVYLIMRFSGLDNLTNFKLYDHGILYYYLAGLGSALGHCYPIFLKFKGGKAVSCYFGIAIMCSWVFAIFALIFFLILKLKKYVSLASILTSSIITLVSWVIGILTFIFGSDNLSGHFGTNLFMNGNGLFLSMGIGYELPLVLTLITIILIFRHKANIKRLLNGTESKIKWMK